MYTVAMQVDMSGMQMLDENAYERRLAQDLFEKVWRGTWAKRLGLRRANSLRDLNEKLAELRTLCPKLVSQGHYDGVQLVKLSAIKGSEGRKHDFDADFAPLHERVENRWVSVAMAILSGKSLPPVELVKVGDEYYVRDGHHRISVARALRQDAIEAEVTVQAA
jgi:hypothetical protein